MGSGQSSAGDINNKGSFSVDPSGKISQPKPKVPPKQQQQTNQEDTENNQTRPSSDSDASHQRDNQSTERQQPQETTQLSTSNNMNRSTNDIGLSLQEADEVLTRMKAKYKPNSAEIAGKGHRGELDEIERNLLHCYKTHKDEPLACARLSKQYQEFVRLKRGQFLQEQLKSERPIET